MELCRRSALAITKSLRIGTSVREARVTSRTGGAPSFRHRSDVSQTDWDRELKRIEREFEVGSADPIIRLDNSRKAAARNGKGERPARTGALVVWIRVVLVVALAVGMYFWPYARACGVGLFSYMGAATLVGAGALWAAASSWQARLVRAHAASMLMLIVALALLATQILPRVGYANVDPADPPTWMCAAAR